MVSAAADADDNKAYVSNYMLLHPDEVGARGLLHILTTPKLAAKSEMYIDAENDDDNLFDGWLLFLSVVILKVLHLVARPMAWMGAAIEFFLNFLSNNGGFVGLLLRILQLKVVIPDRSSPTYLSTIAHIDGRIDIDSKIKPGDSNYYQVVSLLASKIAYENKAYIKNVVEGHWKMELLDTHDFWNEYIKKFTTQAFMMCEKRGDSEMIIVAFRGTEPFSADDWCTDFDISWYKLPGVGKMHAGFQKALGLQKNHGWPKEINYDPNHPPAYYYIRGVLQTLLETNPRAKFIVTGHSLGGALAILFPSILALHNESRMLERLEGVYTYGQPRVGDGKFGEFVQARFKEYTVRYVRFVYCNDMVPRIPFDDSGRLFKHFGTCHYYSSIYRGHIVEEEPYKNYFSVFGIIPMTLNAMWEIARGFIYAHTKGPAYRESWFLFFMRLFGLILPGIPAHILHDYNNSTRLGSLAVCVHKKLEDKVVAALH